MVFFFESSEGYVMYMGKDKYENEDLIKFGLPEDLWFHVDDLSSAHVYLRLRKDQKLEDVSPETIMECAQLVKANSIEGCKLSSVYVIYTRWRNLKKTANMVAGQVSYHNPANVKRMLVEKNNSIVNRLNKTKEERHPDLEMEQQDRAAVFRAEQKAAKRAEFEAAKAAEKDRFKENELKSYSSLMQADRMVSNAEIGASVGVEAANDYEDDFM